jgi:hypothetical protein
MLEYAEKFGTTFEKLDEADINYRDYFGDVGTPF